MKASEIIALMESWAPGLYEKTCDTVKAGDPERDVSCVAMCCFATPNVIREASTWGAQLLITHEPTVYDHWDNIEDTPVGNAKRALLGESDLVLYRYHDHLHAAPSDMIGMGEIETLGLKGVLEERGASEINRFSLTAPMTVRELARHIEKKMNIAHMRICGAADASVTKLALAFGTPRGVFEELAGWADVVLTGEACEWRISEYARDAAQLGFSKALLILGHCGSERDGMRYIANRLSDAIPELSVRYIESGEVYTYSEKESRNG